MDLEVDVVRVDGDLCGVVDLDGDQVIVAGGGVGDRLRVRIDHASPHRRASWASIVERVSLGPDTLQAPACRHAAPLAGACGGCPGMHLSYEAQLAAKSDALNEVLTPLAPARAVPVQPSPRTEGWRNRTNHVVAVGPDGRARLGSKAPRSDDFADMDGCRVVREPIAAVATGVAAALSDSGRADAVRYVSIRANRAGECLVELIVWHRGFPWLTDLANAVLALDGVVGVASSRNTSRGNALRVEPAVALVGCETITEQLGDVVVHVTADTFLQLNPEVAQAMLERTREWAAAGGLGVADLYCGVGVLGLSVGGASLVGVESHPGAVRLARLAARGQQAHFVESSLGEAVPDEVLAATVVLANPPRRGLHAPVLAALGETGASKRLVYMSCNPASFVRDARSLADAGWSLTEVEAWDMLPHTCHVELLGRFDR